jgi:hypothetical protein
MQDEKLVILGHVGSVSDDEFLSSYREFFNDARYDRSFNVLVDLRRADSSARGPEALRDFAGFVGRQFADTKTEPKVAVVAPQDISFGLARMYEAFSDTVPLEFKVFRGAEAALSWLGLPENLVDNLEQNADPQDPTDPE